MAGYDEHSISVLEGLEAVRKRPGMYIGSVSRKGLNHLIYEIVDNSVDEHLAGACDTIHVTLEKNGSCTVEDNGRGFIQGQGIWSRLFHRQRRCRDGGKRWRLARCMQ